MIYPFLRLHLASPIAFFLFQRLLSNLPSHSIPLYSLIYSHSFYASILYTIPTFFVVPPLFLIMIII